MKNKKFGISTIHKIAKTPELREMLKDRLADAYEAKLDEIIDRIALLDDILTLRGEYDKYFGEARWSFFNGYPLATISLSCICAERLLIDLLMESEIKVNDCDLTDKEKETVFSTGAQPKRIKLALSLKLINEETSGNLEKLNAYRHKYIHPNKPIKVDVEKDAKDAIVKLHKIVTNCFPFEIEPAEKEDLTKMVISDFIKQSESTSNEQKDKS